MSSTESRTWSSQLVATESPVPVLRTVQVSEICLPASPVTGTTRFSTTRSAGRLATAMVLEAVWLLSSPSAPVGLTKPSNTWLETSVWTISW